MDLIPKNAWQQAKALSWGNTCCQVICFCNFGWFQEGKLA